MRIALLRRLRSSGAYGPVVESDAISDALATRAGIAIKPWKYATTLFTDTAGTVAASQPGDIIAVAKDDSRGFNYGASSSPTSFTNSGFETFSEAGGSFSAEKSIAGGSDTAYSNASFSVTVGKVYEVVAVVSAASAGVYNLTFTSTTNSRSNAVTHTGTGTKTALLVPTITGTWSVSVVTASVMSFTVDSISVREVQHGVYKQDTLANRPILTRWPKAGKRNLLTYTEDFSNAVWVKTSATIAANATSAPDGETTADRITATAVSSRIDASVTVATSTTYTFSIYAKSDVSNWLYIQTAFFTTPGNVNAWFDVANGIVGTVNAGLTASISAAGNGFYRCSITFTTDAVDTAGNLRVSLASSNNATTCSVSDSIFTWGAQVEVGSSATAYQKVTIAQDITEAGQSDCWGLTFDGTNDGMATAATLDLSGSDKVGVFAGIYKTADSVTQVPLEHSASITANNGAFLLLPGSGGARWYGAVKGTTQYAAQSATTFTAPLHGLNTLFGNIAAPLTTLRNNGVSLVSNSSSLGTGNFGNYTNYIGARAGTSLYFNGIIWGAAIVSTLTTADTTEIAAIEAQIADNTPTVSL